MRRLLTITITAVIALFLFNPMASAGSPHFVGGITVERSGDSLTVSGKEAGLGNEEQVHIVVSATALCIKAAASTRRPSTREASRTRVTSPSRTARPSSR